MTSFGEAGHLLLQFAPSDTACLANRIALPENCHFVTPVAGKLEQSRGIAARQARRMHGCCWQTLSLRR